MIWILAYLEYYLYKEEDIDQADVDKYEKMIPGFMDYDVSNILRYIHGVELCTIHIISNKGSNEKKKYYNI